MKICPECGASNSDDYKFCMACGATLGDETVPDNETALASAPVYSAGPAPSYSCGSTLNEIMSGNSVLAAAIFATLAFALSIASSFFAGSGLLAVLDGLDSLLAALNQNGVIPFSDIEGMLVYSGADVSRVAGSNFSFTVRFNLTAIILPAVLWIIWGTARSGKLSKAVFVVLKVFAIIGLVLIVIATVTVAGICIFAATYGVSYAGEYGVFLRNPLYAFAALAIVFCGLLILVNVCSVRTWGSIAKACDGAYNGKISVITAAMYMYSGISSVIFAVIGAAISASLSPMLAVGALGSVCSGVCYVLMGYAILKTKTLLEKEQ